MEETKESEEENTGQTHYYPNCDLTIWLRDCHEETRSGVEGQIIMGNIPSWLNGVLLQNGPGGTNVYGQDSNSSEANCCQHLFDGPGLLQKYEFSNGRVTYTSRFIQTKSHERNRAAGRLVVSEFGTVATTLDPCQTIFGRISTTFTSQLDQTLTDTANISVHQFGDEIYSVSETPFAHRIKLENLDTLYTVNVNSEIGIVHHTSHPHVDKMRVYNIGQKIDLWNGPHYVIIEMKTNSTSIMENNQSFPKSPFSQAKILATIPSRWLVNICYMHSFSLTDNYFILIEQPLSIFLPEIPINHILGKPIASCLKYFPEEDTIFHVLPRDFNKKGRQTFRSHSFFFLHTINAYERESVTVGGGKTCEIIVDICCYNDPKMLDCMYIESLRNAHSNPDYAKMFKGRPKRFRLPLHNDNEEKIDIVEGEILVDFGCETPQINYDLYNGKAYKYFYAISSDVDLEHPGLLVKVNTEMKTWMTWGEPQLKSYPSEPIFVPTPGGKEEDDGIILSSLLYGGEPITGPNNMSVIILDAKKLELITKIDFPNMGTSMVKSLHGSWFDDNMLKVEEKT